MRIFIGIKVSKSLEERIGEWQKRHRELQVRWIKPQNLHITLVPPGNEAKVKEKFELMRRHDRKKFTIFFDTIRARNRYHVITVEARDHHVTVARYKGNIDLEEKHIHWEETVNNITLFESRLGKKEANYYEIDKILVG